MAKTILITDLDRIEHEYDPTKVYFSFMISVLCKLADGDVPKNVNWDYMQPWKWKDSRVRFGCYDINSNPVMMDDKEINPHHVAGENGGKLITSVQTRRDLIYGEEKKRIDKAPLVKPSPLFQNSLRPSGSNEVKNFPEFLINEANRPLPVAQELNLNHCFSITKVALNNLATRCVSGAYDHSKLRFFAFLEFDPKQEVKGYDFIVSDVSTECKYTPNADGHDFAAEGNNLTYKDIFDPYDDSWIDVNLDFDDWLGTLRKNLTEGLDFLGLLKDVIFHDKVNLKDGQIDICKSALKILIANRISYSAPDGNAWLELLKSSDSSDPDKKQLARARSTIKNGETYIIDEKTQHNAGQVNNHVDSMPDEIKTLLRFLDIQNPFSEQNKSKTELELNKLLKDISDPNKLSDILGKLFSKYTGSAIDISTSVVPPSGETLARNNALFQKKYYFVRELVLKIEKARLEKDPKDIPGYIKASSIDFWKTALSSVAMDSPEFVSVFKDFLEAKATDLSKLVPESASNFKEQIPRSEVQPVSLDAVSLISKNKSSSIARKMTGIGFLLKEDTAGKDWRCLNLCSIFALVYDGEPKLPSDDEYKEPEVARLSKRSVVPLKLTKTGGILQTTAVYNNLPLCGKNALSKLADKTQQSIISHELTVEDYLSYDLALEDDGITPYSIPMLVYGKSYQAAAFKVDKCGALPLKIAADPITHPGLLIKKIDGTEVFKSSKFLYQRQVGFGSPRVEEELKPTKDGINYLESEVLSHQLIIQEKSTSPEKLKSTTCRGAIVASVLKDIDVGKQNAKPHLVIEYFDNDNLVCSLDFNLTTKSISLSVGSNKFTGSSTAPINSIELTKKSSVDTKLSVATLVNNKFEKVKFGNDIEIKISNSEINEFQVTVSAYFEDVGNKSVLHFKEAKSQTLDTSGNIASSYELLAETRKQFIFLPCDRWSNPKTPFKPSTYKNISIHPASTSLQNWDRWFAGDDRNNKDARIDVIQKYFNNVASSDQEPIDTKLKFAINDPACDQSGYAELVKVFPKPLNEKAVIGTEFKYDYKSSTDSKVSLTVKTNELGKEADLKFEPTFKLEATIPEGELWELRTYTCVAKDNFGPDRVCHQSLAGSRTVKIAVKDRVTGKDELKDHYVFSPSVIRIEAATDSELFTIPDDALLESIRNTLVINDNNGEKLEVFLDVGKLNQAKAKYHYLFSDINLHWQSWQWDGKTLSRFPFEQWNKLDSNPSNAAAEQSVLLWEAKEFSRPESEHFSTTNRLTINDEKILLFTKDLSADTKADFYRFAITMDSRYRPLMNSLRITTFDLLDKNITCWKRKLIRCKLKEKLPAPLVKIVFPLTNRFGDKEHTIARTCPDMLVILHEPPFRIGGLAEKIMPEVCSVMVPDQLSPNKNILEFGPDPILEKAPGKNAVIDSKTNVWASQPDLGGRQFGFFSDLATDQPRFTASALVLPAPDPLLINGVYRDDFAWHMMKIQFRRVIEKNGTIVGSFPRADDESIYRSDATPATWIQYLPDSAISNTLLDQHLVLDGKKLRTADDKTEISPKAIGWSTNSSNTAHDSVFFYCAMFTELVYETDGITRSEKYHSVFRFKSSQSGELDSAEVEPDVRKLLKEITERYRVRILEIQTNSSNDLKSWFDKTEKRKSLWDLLFMKPENDASNDAIARITRISQPFEFGLEKKLPSR